MTASVIGPTAVLVAFEPAFLAVRLIGSAYLIVLGLSRISGMILIGFGWPPNQSANCLFLNLMAGLRRGPDGRTMAR